jgi:hypothetical protein
MESTAARSAGGCAVADAAIPHALGGDRRRLGQRVLPFGNVVEALEDHGDHPAQMGIDDFQFRIFLWDACLDQMHHRNGIFHRRSNRPAQD